MINDMKHFNLMMNNILLTFPSATTIEISCSKEDILRTKMDLDESIKNEGFLILTDETIKRLKSDETTIIKSITGHTLILKENE